MFSVSILQFWRPALPFAMCQVSWQFLKWLKFQFPPLKPWKIITFNPHNTWGLKETDALCLIHKEPNRIEYIQPRKRKSLLSTSFSSLYQHCLCGGRLAIKNFKWIFVFLLSKSNNPDLALWLMVLKFELHGQNHWEASYTQIAPPQSQSFWLYRFW